MREILPALRQAVERGDETVLVTVVGAAGSVYRREGAKSLMSPTGRAIGTISGGCLDTDLRERARAVLADRVPRLVSYDTRAMNDELFGLGLGCGGEIEVWIEPLDWWASEGGRAAIEAIEAAFARGASPIIATVLRRAGVPMVALERWLTDEPIAGSERRTLSDGVEVFFDRLESPRRMIVVGAGADAEPVVELAASVGFEVTLVSDRDTPDLEMRFPRARHVVRDVRQLATFSLHGTPAVVLVTHRAAVDRDVLRALLPRAAQLSYLGVLGPRTRAHRLLEELAAEGVTMDELAVGKLHGPAGLDLGSESPTEIALAIVAEALAASNGRSARPLREKTQ